MEEIWGAIGVLGHKKNAVSTWSITQTWSMLHGNNEIVIFEEMPKSTDFKLSSET